MQSTGATNQVALIRTWSTNHGSLLDKVAKSTWFERLLTFGKVLMFSEANNGAVRLLCFIGRIVGYYIKNLTIKADTGLSFNYNV